MVDFGDLTFPQTSMFPVLLLLSPSQINVYVAGQNHLPLQEPEALCIREHLLVTVFFYHTDGIILHCNPSPLPIVFTTFLLSVTKCLTETRTRGRQDL